MSPFTHLVCSLVQVYRMKTLTGYGLLPKRYSTANLTRYYLPTGTRPILILN